jgi:putative restriction endonuclease
VIAPLSPLTWTRLEKAAIDNGFDQSVPVGDSPTGWLGFASTKAPLWIWLGVDAAGCPVLALSQSKFVAALASLVRPTDVPIPLGARAVVGVSDMTSLHGVLRRAFQLARALPDEPLRRFAAKTSTLPRGTEIERLEVQRIGQDVFRDALLEYWEGRCPVTGLAVPALLRASHIKPWADCEADAERLDVFNGLLLAPHMDSAFDGGFVTFEDDGAIVISAALDTHARRCLGLHVALALKGLADRHRIYLAWHRERVYRACVR